MDRWASYVNSRFLLAAFLTGGEACGVGEPLSARVYMVMGIASFGTGAGDVSNSGRGRTRDEFWRCLTSSLSSPTGLSLNAPPSAPKPPDCFFCGLLLRNFCQRFMS